METTAWVNGRIVDARTPILRFDDHGLVGDGAFEAIKVVDGTPFALTRHLQRLRVSADAVGIAVDLEAIRDGIRAVLAAASPLDPRCWLRVTVTGGSAPMGTGGIGTTPTMIAAIAPMASWGPTADVVVVPWTRNAGGAAAGRKTISYAENVIALRHAHALGADEGVFANTDQQLCEGTGSNVFVAIGGRLITPPLTSGCLAGVTRALLLEWLPGVVEDELPIAALGAADEAFLTSSSRDVHPIATVDGSRLRQAPGPLTREARRTFTEGATADLDPCEGPRTPLTPA